MRFLRHLPLATTLLVAIPLQAVDWKPITPEELQLSAPKVEKGADAEAIFWEVRISDGRVGEDLVATRRNYIRMKIFAERGRDRAKVELTYGRKSHLSDVAGRTIKPDGRIVEMKKDGVFDTELVKGKGVKIHAKSFTLPDVQPGDIIEYQWQEVETNALSNYMRLPLQRDIPVQNVRYYVKPFSSEYVNVSMRALTFHSAQQRFKEAPQGFSLLEFSNMAAFREEPDMAPEDELRAWALIYYSLEDAKTPEKYWPEVGRKLYSASKDEIKVSAEAKKAAAEAVAGATTDEAKARAIYAWVHRNVKNIYSDLTPAEDRRRAKPNKNSNETLKQGLGTGGDINSVFIALALAAGLDARVCMTGDRSDMFFTPKLADQYFLQQRMAAIKVSGEWRYYDPASVYSPAELPMWQEQGLPVLIADGKTPEWSMSNLPRASESAEDHTFDLKLATDGSISGTFAFTWTGHIAVSERSQLMRRSPAERDEHLTEEMKSRFGAPEISDIKWTGVDDPEQTLGVTFGMKIPNYMQRTGRRTFVQPILFQKDNAVRYTSSTREHPIVFPYPWSETDKITIELPQGYVFEAPELPAGVRAGDTFYWEILGRSSTTKAVLERKFFLGEDRAINFPQSSYPALKTAFEKIREGDQMSLVFRQDTAK